MSELLHQLENNEAILLMYIAGELPDVERREVEQMLASDARMRAMYDELRQGWGDALAGIEQVDVAEPLAMSREAAVRQVGRMVRQWHAERVAAIKPVRVAAKKNTLRFYIGSVSAVAAVMLVGFLVWWGVMADPVKVTTSGNELATRGNPVQQIPGRDGESSRDRDGDWEILNTSAVQSVDVVGFGGDSLDDVEKQATHLVDLGRGQSLSTDN